MKKNGHQEFQQRAGLSPLLLGALMMFCLGGVRDAMAAPVLVQPGGAAGYMYFPAENSGGSSSSTVTVQVSMSAGPQVPEDVMKAENAGSCQAAAVAGQICDWGDGLKFQYVSQLNGRKLFAEYVATKDTTLLTTGCYGVSLGMQDENDGIANTNAYLRAEQVTGGCSYSGVFHPAAAAAYCQAKSMYLPAKNELAQIFLNRGSLSGLDVSGIYYWSSSEHPAGDGNGWVQLFSTGAVTNGFKYNDYLVRCVRSF